MESMLVIKRLLIAFMALFLVVLAVIVVRTLSHQPLQTLAVDQVSIQLEAGAMAERLSKSIRFKTVSHRNPQYKDRSQFLGFIDWVRRSYPRVDSALELTMHNDTMLYRWEGSDASLAPILVTGHYDVVPVIPGSESKWNHPPYDGVIADGIVWGRGALDDKSGVLGILEAVTYLIDRGHQPKRTVYLSFGHDEEIGGREGAAMVAAYLREQQVQLAWSLDEGSFVFDGLLPGVDGLVAAINVAEKGSITLDIVATSQGGHSSMPTRQNAVNDLARAITKLEEKPIPGGLEGLSAELFDRVSRHMPFLTRALFANQWLFGPVIDEQFSSSPTTNAMLRTTTAPTMLSGSVKTNILPIEAVATVNFRIHPRDSMESIETYVSDLVGSETISVKNRGGRNASAVSDWHASGYQAIAKSMREVYGEVVVAPGLMIAASDSRHYGQVADNAYRFNPIRLTPELLTGFHGTNERISIEDYVQGVRGYIRIIDQGTSN